MEEEADPGIPEWVVTFGDMMSLLLTFFIMLVSLSEVKQNKKYQALVESIRRRFGHESALLSMAPGDQKPRNSNLEKLASQGRALRANTMRGGAPVKAPTGENARVEFVRPGRQTAVGGRITFAAGSAELTDEAKAQLQIVARQVMGKPQTIEIRGHTSPRKETVDGTGVDDWELAYRRCRAVYDFLISLRIEPRRIRISQAANHEPLSEDAADVAVESARVEVFLLNELAESIDGG